MAMSEEAEVPKFAYTFSIEKYGKALVILNLFYDELPVPGRDPSEDKKFARIVFERGKAEELAKLLSIFLNVKTNDPAFHAATIKDMEGIIDNLPHRKISEED